MRLSTQKQGKKTRGQTMVEFALVLPLLLAVMFGIMEFGRLLFIYVTTTSAAREATRYASAVDDFGGIPRFQDCSGIRNAARQVDFLNAIQTINIRYYVDYGGVSSLIGTCPTEGDVNQIGPELALGNQVVVEINSSFDPIIPGIVPISINQIDAESARTVIKDIPVGVLVPPLSPANDVNIPPPWISFVNYYSFQTEACPIGEGLFDEDCAGHTYNLPIKITDENGNSYDPEETISVEYWISGLSEARRGYDYTIAGYDETNNRGYVDITDESGAVIPINIINDLLYEYYERIIIYLREASPEGNVVWPNVHVIYIIDNDRIPPVVSFETIESEIYEPDGFKDIRIKLDKLSGRNTIVPFDVVEYYDFEDPEDPLLPNPAVPGYDYISPTSPITIPAGVPFVDMRIPIIDDSLLEGPETIKLTLVDDERLSNATLGEPFRHTLTIIDNEVINPVCALSVEFLEVNNLTYRARITNSGSIPIYISRVYIKWQSRNLSYINFGGETIWSEGASPTEVDLTFFPLNINRRLLNETKNLDFIFQQNNARPSEGTIYFDNGCSISFTYP